MKSFTRVQIFIKKFTSNDLQIRIYKIPQFVVVFRYEVNRSLDWSGISTFVYKDKREEGSV